MSRSGYSDELDNWTLIRWRGAVASAARGRRGQKFFRDLVAALDAMEVKELIPNALQNEKGGVCALGAVGRFRGLDLSRLDPDEPEDVADVAVADLFGIASALAREVAYVNDEAAFTVETPADRWRRVRRWAESNIKQ